MSLNTLLTSKGNKRNHQSSDIVTIQTVLNVLVGIIGSEKQIKVVTIRKEETNCIYMYIMWLFMQKNSRLQIIKTKNLVRLLDIRSIYKKHYIPIYQQRLRNIF